MRAERGRLTLALLLSLLFHTLLLSLTFGGENLGLPGFIFPWRERRIEAPDLRVVLMPARTAAAEPAKPVVKEPLPPASIEKAVARVPARAAEVVVLKDKGPNKAEAKPVVPAAPVPEVMTGAVPAVMPANTPLQTEASNDAAPPPTPVPEVIAVERSAEPTFAVPPPPPAPVIAVATSPEIAMPAPRVVADVPKPDPAERELQAQRQAEQLEAARVEAARLEIARQEAARAEAARLEAARAETARQETQRLEAARLTAAQEAQRQEAARQEAAQADAQRKEAARLEALRQEAARLAAAQREAQRQEIARQEAARNEASRQEAARLDAARQETARLDAERLAAVRQAAAQKEAARIQEEKDEDARRAARREAMGRQLNEEAARRDAASKLPYSLSTARRGRLWGRSDANVELVQYAEAWARRIQFNTPVETVRELAKRPHTQAMVTVAIRSDGTVESVTFVASSGVAEVDEAIRRIVQNVAPNPAFPPALALEYDVIEVRRTWHFDTAVRLY